MHVCERSLCVPLQARHVRTYWKRCADLDLELEAISPTRYKAFNAWYTIEFNRVPASADNCLLRNAQLRQRSNCMQLGSA